MKYALEYQWQKGIDESLSQGIEHKEVEVITRMLAQNYDWKAITIITGLDKVAYKTLNRLLNNPIQRLFGCDFAKVRHTQLASFASLCRSRIPALALSRSKINQKRVI